MTIPSKRVKSTTQRDNRRTQTRIRVCIPKNLHGEPVISRLVSHYEVTVNITAARLSANLPSGGCFELELRGTASNIESALIYLNELNLEIWHFSTSEQDGW
ncbi:MAG: NIL domain-containing protein [Rhizonema sp. NSF051]|nr:NIL domain-containing protein [Rhizonema sp. NSF051]